MNIKAIIESNENNSKKYQYYRDLGCSEKTASVLTLVTYGDSRLSRLVRKFRREELFEKLYALLAESGTEDIQHAIEFFLDYGFPYPEKAPDEEIPTDKADALIYSLLRENIDILDTLAPREKKILELRYGLIDGRIHSSEDVARQFNVFPERIRMVEAKALRKLRHPSRSKKLKIDLSFEEPLALYKVEESEEAEESAIFSAPYAASYASPSLAMSCYEELSSDSYEQIEEKNASSVFTSPSSTFRMTTNTASMGVVLNQIRSGRRVDMSEVRIEEVLNYFDYENKSPEEEKFAIYTELLPKDNNKKLLYIQVQAKQEAKEHQNIVFLLDVSGSMYGNAEITQAAFAAFISKLKPGDIFSLITYANEDHTVVNGFEINGDQDKEKLMAFILGLQIDGCTYGSAGIETAYQIGKEYYHEGWSNQVILITDGDLNFGITEKGGLKNLIEEKKKTNLFLTVIGTGLWNYKDDNLEVLAKHGNGVYCVVNNLEDVEESICKRYISLTNVIAKDVKAQVEFNPKYVMEYRLLGYENRQLQHEDFKNDTVISEPYGSGGHGIAMYELTINYEEIYSDLKYQRAVLNDSDELCTVKVRYKEPLSDVSNEISKVVYPDENYSPNAQLAYLLYCISEKLRGSGKLDEYDKQFLNVMQTSGFNSAWLARNGEKLQIFLDAYKI